MASKSVKILARGVKRRQIIRPWRQNGVTFSGQASKWRHFSGDDFKMASNFRRRSENGVTFSPSAPKWRQIPAQRTKVTPPGPEKASQ